MARFRLTTRARTDLREAFRYVIEQGRVAAARRLRLRIRDSLLLLAEQPYIGIARPELEPNLRSHAVPNTRYIIFYYPTDYGVEIASVFHGSQDLRRLFDQ